MLTNLNQIKWSKFFNVVWNTNNREMCWWRIDHLISVSDSIISWYEKNIGKKTIL